MRQSSQGLEPETRGCPMSISGLVPCQISKSKRAGCYILYLDRGDLDYTSPADMRKNRNHPKFKKSPSPDISTQPESARNRVFQHISGPRKRSTPTNMCEVYNIDYPLDARTRPIQCLKLCIRTVRGFRRDLSSSSCNDCVAPRLPTCSDSQRGGSESGRRLGQSIARSRTDRLSIA